MKKVFLSFAFRDEDRGLVTAAEQLLASHDLVAVTGKRLAGEALTPAVMQRIEACDALVALLTRRDLKTSGKWTTHVGHGSTRIARIIFDLYPCLSVKIRVPNILADCANVVG